MVLLWQLPFFFRWFRLQKYAYAAISRAARPARHQTIFFLNKAIFDCTHGRQIDAVQPPATGIIMLFTGAQQFIPSSYHIIPYLQIFRYSVQMFMTAILIRQPGIARIIIVLLIIYLCTLNFYYFFFRNGMIGNI